MSIKTTFKRFVSKIKVTKKPTGTLKIGNITVAKYTPPPSTSGLKESSYLKEVESAARSRYGPTISAISSGGKQIASSIKSSSSTNTFNSTPGNILTKISTSRSSSRSSSTNRVPTPQQVQTAEALKTSLGDLSRGSGATATARGLKELAAASRSQNRPNPFFAAGVRNNDKKRVPYFEENKNIIQKIKNTKMYNKQNKFVPTAEQIAVSENLKSSVGALGRSTKATDIGTGFKTIFAASRSQNRPNPFFAAGVRNNDKKRVPYFEENKNIIQKIKNTKMYNKQNKFVPTKEAVQMADALKTSLGNLSRGSKAEDIGRGASLIYKALKSEKPGKKIFIQEKGDILKKIKRSYDYSKKANSLRKPTEQQKLVASALGVSLGAMKTAAKDPKVQAQVTLLAAEALTPAIISRSGNLIRAANLRATGTFKPAEEIFSQQSLKTELGKGVAKGKGLTTGSTASRTYKQFKSTKGKMPYYPKNYVGVSATATPGKIKEAKLTAEKLKQFLSKKGLPEDPGIYITPKGQGSTLFLRISGQRYQVGLVPKIVIGKPSVYEIGFRKIAKYPKGVIKAKGFNITKAYQEANVGKSKAYITKRHTLGHTSEPEAVIPIGERLKTVKTKKPLYTVIGDEVVPIYRTRLVPTPKRALIYKARDLGIKVKKRYTVKDLQKRINKKLGKTVSVKQVQKETRDLYNLASSGASGKRITIPLYNLYKPSTSNYSSKVYNKYSSSISSGKSSSGSSGTSRGSSSGSRSSSSSNISRPRSSSTTRRPNESSSTGRPPYYPRYSSSKRESSSRRGGSSSTGRPPTKNPPTTTLMLFRKNIPKGKNKFEAIRAYRPMVKVGRKFVDISKGRKLNYNAAFNILTRTIDDRKITKGRLMKTNAIANVFQRGRSNLSSKFRTKGSMLIEKKRFIRDRPLEKRRR